MQYAVRIIILIVYLDMLIGLWRRGDGGGAVKKESKKEVETVANNYPS
jgi:hypothetical protein